MSTTPTPPKLKRPAYHLWLAPEGTDPSDVPDDQAVYHHVVVNTGDQLLAELEASKLKLDPTKHHWHLTALWLWAASHRAGIHDEPFRTFRTRLLNYDPDQDRGAPITEDDDDELDELDAHPTEASTG